jgi:tetratricopeptide (TPR) repeat protein
VSSERLSDDALAMTADTQLDTLEAKGLIRLATLRPELEYLFRHALVQDAAYGSLLKQERRELHARVGEALEALYPDRRDELAPVLGMHFEQAGASDKAVDYFVAGGEHAYSQNALAESFDAFSRASTLLDQAADANAAPADPEERRRRIEVELGRAKAGYSILAPEEHSAALERVVEAAEELGDLRLIGDVHVFIALVRLQNGDPPSDPGVKRSLDRIAQVAEELGDPSLRATPLVLVGLSMVFAGDNVRAGIAALEEALPLMEQSQSDSIGAAFARGALAIGYAYLGEFEKADAAAARATELAQKGDIIAKLDALIAESIVRSAQGQLDRVVPIAQECVERAEETGATACAIASSWILGDAFHRQGRFAEARDVLRRGSDISGVLDRRVWRPTLQAWLGTTQAALGEATDADFDEALATARSINNRIGEAGILGKRAETLAGRGELDAARADFEASAAIAEQLGLRPALARGLRAWGEALRTAGRASEAEPILRRSLALFEELSLDTEANAVRALLTIGETKLSFS